MSEIPLRQRSFSPAPDQERPRQNWLNRVVNAFGLSNGDNLKEKIEKALQSDASIGDYFSPDERMMLLAMLNFGELRVDDVMVSRGNILAIEENAPLEDLLNLFAKAGHSRVPVYRGSLDEPLGMIHIKDLMRWMTQSAADAAKRSASANCHSSLDLQCIDLKRPVHSLALTRKILNVAPSMPVTALLRAMQKERIHLALVIDEFGGTDGLVSIEDLIEEVVGDIEDEHDIVSNGPQIVENENGIVAEGSVSLKDLTAHLGVDLALPEDEEETESLGGLILSLAGRLPAKGEHVRHPAGYDIVVLTVGNHRIGKVLLKPISHNDAVAKPVLQIAAKPGHQAI